MLNVRKLTALVGTVTLFAGVAGLGALASADSASAAAAPGTLYCNTAGNGASFQTTWSDTNSFTVSPASPAASATVTLTWVSNTGLSNGSPVTLDKHTVQVQVLVGLSGAGIGSGGNVLAVTAPDSYPTADIASGDPLGKATATTTFTAGATAGQINYTVKEVIYKAGTGSLDTYCSTFKGVHTTTPAVNTGNYPAATDPTIQSTLLSGYTADYQTASNAPDVNVGGFNNGQVSGTATTIATACTPSGCSLLTPTTVSLQPSPASPHVTGTTVTLKATVSPSAAAGKVAFFDGTKSLGSAVSVSGGTASISAGKPSTGSHTFKATFTPTDTATYAPSSSTSTYVIEAKPSTSTPKPSTSSTAAEGGAVSKSAVVAKTTCNVSPGVGGTNVSYSNWNVTLKVDPSPVNKGNKVKISVTSSGSAGNNGPAQIAVGQVGFDALVTVGSNELKLTGPRNTKTVASGAAGPPYPPLFTSSQLPLTASTTFTAPGGGSYPVKIKSLLFDTIQGTGANGGDPPYTKDNYGTGTYDSKCNLGTSPYTSPVAFTSPTLTLKVNGPAGSSTIAGSSSSSDPSSGSLAATGAHETLILALLALLALQVGLVFFVRAQRATPARPRGGGGRHA